MMKSHAIKGLLQQTILSSRICQWILQLSQYDLKAVKSQAIVDLLAQFLREEEFPLDDEVPGEVAITKVAEEQWIMKFNGSSIANSKGARVVLYHNGEETMALLFKLELPCSNNTSEYKAYLKGLATALKMGIKHLKVVGDSNLVVYQNRYADVLATLGSQIAFEGSSTRVEINKWRESIIETLQERFPEKQGYEED